MIALEERPGLMLRPSPWWTYSFQRAVEEAGLLKYTVNTVTEDWGVVTELRPICMLGTHSAVELCTSFPGDLLADENRQFFVETENTCGTQSFTKRNSECDALDLLDQFHGSILPFILKPSPPKKNS